MVAQIDCSALLQSVFDGLHIVLAWTALRGSEPVRGHPYYNYLGRNQRLLLIHYMAYGVGHSERLELCFWPYQIPLAAHSENCTPCTQHARTLYWGGTGEIEF
jgi:hypothetical protein